MFGGEWFLAVNHHDHKNWVPSILNDKLWLVSMGMKQKITKKIIKFKMADSKKGHFSKSPILNIILWKLHGLVLGLVGLNDATGIDMAQKRPKN